MSTRAPVMAALLCAVCVLCSCSIEKEDQERISADTPLIAQSSEDPLVENFRDRARQCVLGKTALAPLLLTDYQQSMAEPKDSDLKDRGYLRYQTQELSLMMRKCLRKSDLETGGALLADSIPDASVCARISRDFYAMGKNAEGAYWMRLVINLLGEMNGYEQAGEIFVQRPQTRDIGARMLSASALMGNREARARLLDIVSGN